MLLERTLRLGSLPEGQHELGSRGRRRCRHDKERQSRGVSYSSLSVSSAMQTVPMLGRLSAAPLRRASTAAGALNHCVEEVKTYDRERYMCAAPFLFPSLLLLTEPLAIDV